MPKQLTADELVDYIKKVRRPIYVRNTENFYGIPARTKLCISIDDRGYLSSYKTATATTMKYDFDHQWLWGEYTGKFEIVDDYPCYGYEWLPIGSIVDISEELVNYPDARKQIEFAQINGLKGLKIISMCNSGYLLQKNISEFVWVPAIYCKLHDDESDTPQAIEMTVAQVEEKLGHKVKIVK